MCVFLWACCPFLMCFTVSYESMLAYTIKAHPDALEARTPLIAACSYIRGSCTKCRIPIVIVRIFLLLLLLFHPKTERAAQTVRARELKPGQIVVVVAGTSNPKARSFRPIGGAIAIKSVYLLITPKPLVLDSKFLHIWNPWVRENRKTPLWFGVYGAPFFRKL